MSVALGPGTSVEVGVGRLLHKDREVKCKILNSGFGDISSDLPEFLLVAPSFFRNPFVEIFNEEIVPDTGFLVLKIYSDQILFNSFPAEAIVETKASKQIGNGKTTKVKVEIPVRVTAILGAKTNKHHYAFAVVLGLAYGWKWKRTDPARAEKND